MDKSVGVAVRRGEVSLVELLDIRDNWAGDVDADVSSTVIYE